MSRQLKCHMSFVVRKFMNLIVICLNQNYFQFENNVYARGFKNDPLTSDRESQHLSDRSFII